MRKIFITILFLFCYFNISAQAKISKTGEKNKIEIIDEKIPYKEILLSFLGTLSAFLIWRVQHQKDKIKDIESQLSEKKYKLYSEIVYLIVDLSMASKMGEKPLTEEDILKRLLTAKREMFLYAPDNIFKTYTAWTLELQGPTPGVSHFKTYFKMMKLIRKDMGFGSSKINLDDFMLFLMQNKEEYQKFKEVNNW
ncbi:hypothetical protein BC749_107191 [Flavobacterium araucananum]|uniref:DUF4294 domain-containing protein n=1 Tax=Flavobacterium araucananum TaxID=946678 RepID=A0A227PCI1_9FLAO|nr:hypothetical protein [Flavobacterium araucananum]OXG06978.1 hypothetical protein B0A64_09140 [Flavobacterium araucananum]PWJ97392.1 hypothetical protein BC749_107191 [Flavobacterium araucananum]